MLFGLVGQARRLFLRLELGLLRSEVHLRQKRELGLGILLEQLFGGLFLVGGIVQGLGLEWGLCMHQSPTLRSRYIHSFNIIGGLWP